MVHGQTKIDLVLLSEEADAVAFIHLALFAGKKGICNGFSNDT